MSELKPCPFCGFKTINMMGYNYHKVCCSSDDCGINQVPFTRETWNTRAPQSEWISVDDRLPEDVQLVLFRLKGAAKTEKGIHLAGCKTFEADYSRDFYDYDDVSHWMPLPNPPEAKL